MKLFWYERKVDDFRRSLENGAPRSNRATIGAARRDYFPVQADDGSRIHVPLRYLAETARIEVSGTCACTLQGQSSFVVLIVNGAKIPESVKNTASLAAGLVTEKAIDRAVDAHEKAIKGRVQPLVQQAVSEAKGLFLSRSSSNALTRAGTTAVTQAVKFGAKEAISGAVGGVGLVGALALESDSIGHEQSHVGKSENGCQVIYHLTGKKPN